MSLTTDRIEPSMLEAILKDAEPVIVDTESGWQLGRRSRGLYMIYNALGRVIVTEKDEVYHSMLGARPTYTREELAAKIDAMHGQIADMNAALARRDSTP